MQPFEGIQWLPWGEEAFLRARREQKRIFLSISATWCHYCHVMDGEAFAHPEVIRRINREFIPVRVDSDQRPDINLRYNMGGWPTVAVLTSDGRPIVGDTYLPTGALLMMLSAEKSKTEDRPKPPPKAESPGVFAMPPIDEKPIETIAGYLNQAFDPEFGGFAGPPKFPPPWATTLAMTLYQKSGEQRWLKMALLTLDQMHDGEIYDRVDDGFFRYATRGDWDQPHYEKLLETNARMLMVYLDAYRLTGSPRYRALAEGILDYLHIRLAAPDGPWFFGSQAADREYYSLSEEERLQAEAPPLDKTIYADRNALAASTLLAASYLFNAPDHRERALALLDYLWGHFFVPDQGMHHFDNGSPSLPGYLSDPVEMMTALLDAYEATGQEIYLDRAGELVRWIDLHLWDRERGGYWDLPAGPRREGLLTIRLKPFSENAEAAMALNRLYHLTGREGYRRQAGAVLGCLTLIYPPYKHHAAPFALALHRFLSPPCRIVLVGRRGEPSWLDFLQSAHRMTPLWKVILPLDGEADAERLKALGTPPSNRPVAYLCIGERCLPPISRAEDLAECLRGIPL